MGAMGGNVRNEPSKSVMLLSQCSAWHAGTLSVAAGMKRFDLCVVTAVTKNQQAP